MVLLYIAIMGTLSILTGCFIFKIYKDDNSIPVKKDIHEATRVISIYEKNLDDNIGKLRIMLGIKEPIVEDKIRSY